MPTLPVTADLTSLLCLRGFRWQYVAIGDPHAKLHLLSPEEACHGCIRTLEKCLESLIFTSKKSSLY
jgi:hypothetical protein